MAAKETMPWHVLALSAVAATSHIYIFARVRKNAEQTFLYQVLLCV